MKFFYYPLFNKVLLVFSLVNMVFFAQAQPALIKDINTENRQGSNPQNFIEYKGKVYFQAVRQRLEGQTLYVTDGTAAGTQQVLNPATSLPFYSALPMVVCNDLLFFLGTPFNGSGSFEPVGSELCAFDGTNSFLVKDINPGSGGSFPGDMVAYGNELLFSASSVLAPTGFILNNELWRSDGTEAGTGQVKDINAGNNSSNPQFLKVVNNQVIFFADDGVHGREPWVTNGTGTGTTLLKDITAGIAGSVQINPGFEISAVLHDTLYFTAGLGIANQGAEIYRTDGTEEGTILLKNLRAGQSSNPRHYTTIGNSIFFSANVPEAGGIRVFVTNGTEAGTIPVPNTFPFAGQTGYIDKFSAFNNRVYFPRSTAGQGQEYWYTDTTGTAAAVQLKDINPGGGSGVANGGGLLYTLPAEAVMFAMDNSINRELWRTDGTADGTLVTGEIFPGNSIAAIPTQPQAIVFNGQLIFTAQPSSEVAMELYLYNTPEIDLPLHRVAFNAILQNQQVHCFWEIDQSGNTNLRITLERANNTGAFIPVADTSIAYPDAIVKGLLMDKTPAQGSNAYRLKILESNGDIQYSAVRTVTISQQPLVKLMAAPNPAKNVITFTVQGLSTANYKELATISDASGRVVKTLLVQPNFKLDISLWPEGIYYLSLGSLQAAPLRFLKIK